MKLFQMKTAPLGVERIKEFVQNNYVCAGYPGTGDLEHANREEIGRRLMESKAYFGQELEEALESLDIFVHNMQDGDYVVISDGEWVYLGDLGDYFYEASCDQPEDGRCHRRGVTWLKSISITELNARVGELLADAGTVSQYKRALPPERLDLWLADSTRSSRNQANYEAEVDEDTLAEALAVLTAALRCEDAERRERAAVAILQYAKR